MKALIQKELRENLKLAVLGLIVISAILAIEIHSYSLGMKSLAAGRSEYVNWSALQPLVSPELLMLVAYFCAIFGALLGWFQIHNERHRDLWAFLVHRPATRTQIFLGKLVGGLVLYVLVTGMPLAGLVLWAVVPGHVAAPFEWQMLSPIALFLLSGVIYYLAGMLTGLRQARWYGSRALGLGLAVLVSVEIMDVPYAWQALGVVLIGGSILALAIWGGFHSNGFYRGQPAPGKPALVAALTPGCAFLVFLAFAFVFLGLLHLRDESTDRHFQVTRDGAIYKVIRQPGQPAEIADLEGKPALDPNTGRPAKLEDFNKRACNWISVNPRFDNHRYRYRWYGAARNELFNYYGTTPDTLWYNWNRYGRLVGYDVKTRQVIGSLGPEGFASDLSGNGSRLRIESGRAQVIVDGRILCTPDLEHRDLKELFTVTNEDCAAASLATNPAECVIGAVAPVSMYGSYMASPGSYIEHLNLIVGSGRENDILVVTRCFIRLIAADGTVVWTVPYQPAYPDYNQVRVTRLEATNQFALWLEPSWLIQEKTGGKLASHVIQIDGQGQVLKNIELPDLSYHPRTYSAQDKIMCVSLPPVVTAIIPLFSEQPWLKNIPWVLVGCSLAAALVCLPFGWWLGCRYSLSLPARVGWSVFILFLGIPGLLALLCAEEWPAREICPACQNLRVVDREKCEHCGADFRPPEKTGAEIFEPLAAAK